MTMTWPTRRTLAAIACIAVVVVLLGALWLRPSRPASLGPAQGIAGRTSQQPIVTLSTHGTCFSNAKVQPAGRSGGVQQWSVTLYLTEQPGSVADTVRLLGSDACRTEQQHLVEQATGGLRPTPGVNTVTVSYITPSGSRILLP